MKSLLSFRFFFSLIIIFTFRFAPLNAQNQVPKWLEGIWVGKMEIPNAAVLRMGVIVKNDGSAALNIIDQASGDIPIDEILVAGDTVRFNLNNLGITIAGKINTQKDLITSMFIQHGGEFALNLARADALPRLNRPQLPTEPFGYSSHEVNIDNPDAGIRLQGTLTLPKSPAKKVPAVVLLTGSGQQGRDEDVGGHKPFWVIADYLSEHGIAVLRMDDRGFGGSGGNFNRSTTGDFAADALAAVNYLKTRTEIDAGKIGLIGHSEGGATALIAASLSPDVKFIISLSGPIENFGELVNYQMSEQERLQKVPESNIDLEMQWRKKLYEIVRAPADSAVTAEKMWAAYKELSSDDIQKMNWPEGRMNYSVGQFLSPWWKYSLSLDVVSLYTKLDCPALLLFGEKDQQVAAQRNMPLIQNAVAANKKTNITIRLIPGVNHLYQTANTGSEYEYIQIEETISPDVLKLLAETINSYGSK